MITKKIEYKIGKQVFIGMVAYDNRCVNPRPGVLIAHDWSGCNDFAMSKAKAMVELGYVGFALDMYGEGHIGETDEEKIALMTPLIENRQLMSQRINAAYQVMCHLEQVDQFKTGAMGYCLGGMCVLDLARSGAPVNGVVSIHGLFETPSKPECHRFTAKVLALHGYDDPLVLPKAIDDFAEEMTEKKVDWQLHAYGNTGHGFTNPQANKVEAGNFYSESSARRASISAEIFFRECFH